MQILVTITPKFQIHLPVKIRRKMGIKSHGMAKMSIKGGKIVITPLVDEIMDLAGKYKSKKTIPINKLRDYIDYSQW